jgi:hypothetical protein
MIEPIIKVDTRGLSAAVEQAAKNSSKTISDIVNRKLLFCVRGALKLTTKASVEAIKDLANKDPLLPRIINAQRAAQGLPSLTQAEMAVAKKKLIGLRVRAVNFIRAQWAWAIARMIPAVRGGNATIDTKKHGQPKGGAKPARSVGTLSNATVTASGWNDVRGGKGDSPIVTAIVERGLQAAIDAEAESTWAHLADKELQQRVCDPFNKH